MNDFDVMQYVEIEDRKDDSVELWLGVESDNMYPAIIQHLSDLAEETAVKGYGNIEQGLRNYVSKISTMNKDDFLLALVPYESAKSLNQADQLKRDTILETARLLFTRLLKNQYPNREKAIGLHIKKGAGNAWRLTVL